MIKNLKGNHQQTQSSTSSLVIYPKYHGTTNLDQTEIKQMEKWVKNLKNRGQRKTDVNHKKNAKAHTNERTFNTRGNRRLEERRKIYKNS